MCSENKGADQLRSYCEADLHLCFRLCRLFFFPCGGSYFKLICGLCLTLQLRSYRDRPWFKVSSGQYLSEPSHEKTNNLAVWPQKVVRDCKFWI